MGIAIPQVVSKSTTSGSGAQVIDGSLKFDGAAKTHLTRTVPNITTFTLSFWYKPNLVNRDEFFDTGSSTGFYFYRDGQIKINDNLANIFASNGYYRDSNSFYHVVFNSDGSDVNLYVNGVLDKSASVSTQLYSGTAMISSSHATDTADYYLSQYYFIDGQALQPSEFGFTDPLTNTWKPKKYIGTFGTNGFWLPMDGNSPIGQDKSGNGNDWTPVNFGGSVALDNPQVSGARPILNTTQGGTQAGVGVFGSKQNVGYAVTVYNDGGGNKYYIDGVKQDTVTGLIRGATYTFDTSDSTVSSHPFRFSATSNGSHGGGSEYTSGVAAITGAATTITVPHDAPNTLYYYCTSHSGMGADITGITTNEKLADQYASSLVLAMPLVGSANDVTNQINAGSTTKTVTVNNDATSISRGNFYGESFDFDGNGDRLVLSNYGSDFTFDGDFTMECWLFIDDAATVSNPNGDRQIAGVWTGSNNDWLISYSGTGNHNIFLFQLYIGGSVIVASSGVDMSTYVNRWVHLAVVRNSNSIQCFVDGIAKGTPVSNSATFGQTSNVAIGGRVGGDAHTVAGSIQDFRIYKGVAKYTSNFVPAATSPDILPDTPSGVSGGSKLTKITDGAVNFDGSGDYLDAGAVDTAFGSSSDWTLELFIYPRTVGLSAITDPRTGDSTNHPLIWIKSTGVLYYYAGGADRIVGTTVLATNKWHHVAAVRSGGTTTLYLDGKSEGSFSDSLDYASTTNFRIGQRYTSTAYNYNGFISNLRLVNGTAVYTGPRITPPPSAPLTNITNTKLLCCQSNTQAGAAVTSPNMGGINDGTVWSSGAGAGFEAARPATVGFDGDISTFTRTDNASVTATVTLPKSVAFTTLKVRGARDSGNGTITVNGVDVSSQFTSSSSTLETVTITGVTSPLTSIALTGISGSAQPRFSAIYVDDVILVDPLTPNGDAAATNFNPFNTDINTVRGQETGYATLNPLSLPYSASGDTRVATVSNGNLTYDGVASYWGPAFSTIPLGTTGKYYFETIPHSASNVVIGVGKQLYVPGNRFWDQGSGTQTFYYSGGNIGSNGSTLDSSPESIAAFDVIGFAMDCDNNEGKFYKNGILQATVSMPLALVTEKDLGNVYPFCDTYNGTDVDWNFGQKPFKFPPPDGFQPLNTANTRPVKVISRPDQYVGVTTYTGDGNSSGRRINIGFRPDLIWLKSRGSGNHGLYDSVRGPDKRLQSDGTAIEDTVVFPGASNFGFDFGSETYYNASSTNYVAWTWKAGGNKGTFNVDDVGYANASDVNMNTGSLTSSFYNTSHSISGNITTTSITFASGKELSKWFDGQRDTRMEPAGSGTMDFSGISALQNFTGTLQFAVTAYSPNASMKFVVNGAHTFDSTMFPGDTGESDYFPAKTKWITIPVTSLQTVEFTSVSGRSTQFWGMFLDGKQLVDSGVTPDSLPSIAPTGASVGTRQGFSIISYTGDSQGGDGRIPHGLSQEPDFMIFKSRTAGDNWAIYHSSLGRKYLEFTVSSDAGGNAQNRWSSTPTDKVIYLGSDTNINTKNHIMYVWHNVPGLQKFGTYVGNGNGDGPFVELGFRPALVWCKSTSFTNSYTNWDINDSVRDTYNPADATLAANLNDSENSGNIGTQKIDFLSNGFKIRQEATSSSKNTDGETYMYAAWAEAPSIDLYGGGANAR